MDSYEKRYKEALNKAKAAYGTGAYDDQTLEAMFPELAESEDERIRKVIHKILLGMREEIFTAQDEVVTKDKALAYLEKRKEQKPAEWSDDDEKRVKQLIYDTEFIQAHYEKIKEKLGERFNNALIKDCDEQIAWLKSLPMKYPIKSDSWKPSEEQMSMLLAVIRDPNNAGSESCHLALESLYEQLKKL